MSLLQDFIVLFLPPVFSSIERSSSTYRFSLLRASRPIESSLKRNLYIALFEPKFKTKFHEHKRGNKYELIIKYYREIVISKYFNIFL